MGVGLANTPVGTGLAVDVSGWVRATYYLGNGAGLCNTTQWTTSNGNVYMAASSNVGMGGLSAPAYPLDVSGTARATYFVGNGAGLWNTTQWTTSNGNVYMAAGSNVGVGGLSAPAFPLDVSGTARATYFVGNGAGLTGTTQWTTSNGNVYMAVGSNVGVGGLAAPAFPLDVSGTARATYYVGNGAGLWNTTQWTTSNGNVYMAIGSNVGMGGRAVPAYPLDVSGTARATYYLGNGAGLTGTTQWTTSNFNVYMAVGSNVGIGTNPAVGVGAAVLTVAGPALFSALLVAASLGGACITDSMATSNSSVAASAAALSNVNASLGGYLPLAGGTITGALSVAGQLATSNASVWGNVTAATFAGDGSALINLGNRSPWLIDSINNFYVAAGSNVGVGTVPNSGFCLDANGAVRAGSLTWSTPGGQSLGHVGSFDGVDGALTLNRGASTTVQLSATGSTYFVGGSVGVGTTAPISPLHVAGGGVNVDYNLDRSGYGNALITPLYVTGDIAGNGTGSLAGIEVRNSGQTQGIGIGYNGLWATGTSANQDLHVAARGAGQIYLDSTVAAVTAVQIVSQNAFTSTNAVTGLFNQARSAYLMPSQGSFGNWQMSGGAQGNWSGLRFTDYGDLTLLMGGSGSSNTNANGVRSLTNSWMWYCDTNKNFFVYGNLSVGNAITTNQLTVNNAITATSMNISSNINATTMTASSNISTNYLTVGSALSAQSVTVAGLITAHGISVSQFSVQALALSTLSVDAMITAGALTLSPPANFFTSAGSVDVSGTPTSTALWCNNNVYSTGAYFGYSFVNLSDQRMKDPVVQDYDDLDLINRLTVRRFTYKNLNKGIVDCHGGGIKTGFYAQELREVLPSSVIVSSGYTPSVTEECSVTHVTSGVNLISHSCCKLNVGDEIELHLMDGSVMHTSVVDVSGGDVQVQDEAGRLDGCNNVYVYGHLANDLLGVNHNEITSISVGAIQQLYRMVGDLQSQVAALTSNLALLAPHAVA